MDKTLDMTLDDIIKSRKSTSKGRGRGGAPRGGRGGRGSFAGRRMVVGPGAGRIPQAHLRVNARPISAFTIAKPFRRASNIPRQHDLIEESLAAVGLPGIQENAKLHVSNLESGVSNDDIRELFAEVGELKRYAIHYDKNGLPSGSAEVVYTRRSDAFAAIKRYNNVRLDGRPMKIEIVNLKSELPVSARISVVGGVNGASTRRVVTTQGQGRTMPMVPPANQGALQRARGGIRNMRGRGRGQTQGRGQIQGRGQSQGRGQGLGQGRGRGRGGRGKKQPKEKSADELDKELEKYHAEAMETS